MHKDERMVDHVNCKTPFLCFRADSGNFVELVSYTVIFLLSSNDLPVESQLELGETHSCVRRKLYVVGSIKASGVPSYHQSWKPVSQQSSGVLPLKGGGPVCLQEQPMRGKVPLLCSPGWRPLAVLLSSHGEQGLECPEGGKSAFHHREDHKPGKRSWQFKAGRWQFRLIRNMVY